MAKVPSNEGIKCRWAWQKSRFLTNIWLHCVLSFPVDHLCQLASKLVQNTVFTSCVTEEQTNTTTDERTRLEHDTSTYQSRPQIHGRVW